jgi:hypothetical protein
MPTAIAKVLRNVKAIFLGDENHNPLFIWSQNMPVNAKVNQLPKRAVCLVLIPPKGFEKSWLWHTIRVRRLLKTGIASAIIHAIIHRQTVRPTQEPMAIRSRLCIRSVPAKIRM